MTLSATSKKLLLVAVMLMAIGFAMLFFAPKSNAPQNLQPSIAPTENSLAETTDEQPIPLINLYVRSDKSTSTMLLDSEGKKITAISLRLRATEDAVVKQNWFTIDPSLQAAGWQVAINTATKFDQELGYALFDLALINTQPNGGTSFTLGIPIGTFANTIGGTLELDPANSLASMADGNQVNLLLVKEE